MTVSLVFATVVKKLTNLQSEFSESEGSEAESRRNTTICFGKRPRRLSVTSSEEESSMDESSALYGLRMTSEYQVNISSLPPFSQKFSSFFLMPLQS